ARRINPIVRGWIRYYGLYYKSVLRGVLDHLNWILIQWVRRKYKPFRRHQRQAMYWLARLARRQPSLFAHWQMGILPAAE
ncbi:RNA-directed DNA polymerase (Reverse transcriptase), partial [mine drainage metagenome]